MSNIQFRLQRVRQSYLNELPEKLHRLHELWTGIKSDRFSDDSKPRQEEFFTIVHSLGGSGATFGFDSLTNTARPLEKLFTQLKNHRPVEQEHLAQIDTLITVLDETVRSIIRQPGEFKTLDFSIQEESQKQSESNLVYILDSDLLMAEGLAAQLRTRNFQTVLFSNQNELNHAVTERRPLALIVETNFLPGNDADNTPSSMHYPDTDLPVICLSPVEDITSRVNALRAGADFFIHKPVNYHQIINVLDSLIERCDEPAYRVLIIDDDEVLAGLYAGFMERVNVETRVISDPRETLDTIRTFKPELILLDIHMFHINGYEIARLIRQIPEFDIISIIFMSSDQESHQQLIAIDHVGDFLRKPVWPDHLITTVLSKCRHSRKLIQTQNKLKNTLREHESQRLAMDQHSIISITDANGNITYVNHMFCDISGRNELELIGKNHRIVKSDEHSDDFFADLWQTIHKGAIWHGEIRNKAKNGDYYWVETTIVPFLNDDGIPYQYIAVRTDITKTKTAEYEQRQRQQRLLEQNTSLAILTNKEKLFLDDKLSAYGKITELVAETLHIGRTSIWFFNDSRDILVCEYLFDTRNPDKPAECFLVAKKFPIFMQTLSNERIIVANNAHANLLTKELRDEYLVKNNIQSVIAAGIYHEGNCIGMLCCESVNDRREWWSEDKNYVTTIADYIALLIEQWGRQAAQDQLIIAKERAEKASKAKSEFLSRMSHELRTPLNAIIGFSQLMDINPENLSTPQRDNIRDILNAGRHLLGLINEVLDLSAIEAGKVQISLQQIDVLQVVTESIQLITPLTRPKAIKIINNIPALTGASILGDYNRVKQILINLLSNAIKYNINNGEIYISAETGADSVSIIIEDTGYGISPEQMQILFQPFERTSTDHQHVEGSGIGLVICKDLVKLMNGQIECTSSAGVGSKFRIDLPAYKGK